MAAVFALFFREAAKSNRSLPVIGKKQIPRFARNDNVGDRLLAVTKLLGTAHLR